MPPSLPWVPTEPLPSVLNQGLLLAAGLAPLLSFNMTADLLEILSKRSH